MLSKRLHLGVNDQVTTNRNLNNKTSGKKGSSNRTRRAKAEKGCGTWVTIRRQVTTWWSWPQKKYDLEERVSDGTWEATYVACALIQEKMAKTRGEEGKNVLIRSPPHSTISGSQQ